MDEPNAGLDPLVQHEFQQLVRQTVDDGRTVFLSSHTLSEVQRIADRVGIIRHGEMVAVEDIDDLRAVRKVALVLDGEPSAGEIEAISGSRDVTVTAERVHLSFDGELGDLIREVSQHHRIVDLAASEADLEEVFLAFYEDER